MVSGLLTPWTIRRLMKAKGYEYVESYHKEGPVLTAISLEPAEPLAQELVYFN